MSSIFLVTSGRYSDYGVVAAFSTKETAEQFAASMNTNKSSDYDDDARVEEYPLDTPPTEWLVTLVHMSKDGTATQTLPHHFQPDFYVPGFSGYDMRGNLMWVVATRDIERAIKVTNEKRIEILARNEWPEPKKAP